MQNWALHDSGQNVAAQGTHGLIDFNFKCPVPKVGRHQVYDVIAEPKMNQLTQETFVATNGEGPG